MNVNDKDLNSYTDPGSLIISEVAFLQNNDKNLTDCEANKFENESVRLSVQIPN